MKLLIVESPNKIKKIRSILNAEGRSGWDVAASVGHIRDLPVKDLGLEMPGYKPQYELSGRGADVVKALRNKVKAASEVYLATDPDREGEAIAWHVAQVLRLKNARRISFDAITPDVVRRALDRPRTIDANLVHAQEARRVLDRLVGYQVSPMLSRQAARRGLSAGRVQSPAVRLVVEREREIEAFVETRHFGVQLEFDGNAWRAEWETAPFLKKDVEEGDPAGKYILDEALAARAAACRDCKVLSSANRISRQSPPPPFTTSTMLQAASVRLRWKPEVTAQVAQRLFEAGLITYHRTDSQNLSAEALSAVRAYAAKAKLPLPPKARTFRSRGNAQEAHEAIRPTHFPDERAGDDPAQQQLYRLIWERAVASQLADAEWSVNTTRLSSRNGGETFTFKAEGRTLVVPGWRVLTAKDEAEEDEAEGEGGGRVPVLEAGAAVQAENGRVLYKKTQPPPRYTEASLIKRLESLGIGRPSTYPAILKNVQTRGYIVEEKRLLRPTEVGALVIDSLVSRFSFVEYAFTRDLEQRLDDIAEGKAAYLEVVSTADARLQAELGALGAAPRAPFPSRNFPPRPAYRTSQEPPAAAPRAHKLSRAAEGDSRPARRRPTKADTEQAPAIAGTRKRKTTAGATRGTARSAGGSAGTAGGSAAKKQAAKPSGAPEQQPGAAPLCPLCKAGFVRLAREDAKFFGCSGYASGCRFVLWRTIAGRTLRETEVAQLCHEGHTAKLSGFISKAGRPFEATLVLSSEGRVEFSFR